jgi:hypothetical protein
MADFDCWYCEGARSPCTCDEDCGARAEDRGHVCPKAPADVIAAWLRSIGTARDTTEENDG